MLIEDGAVRFGAHGETPAPLPLALPAALRSKYIACDPATPLGASVAAKR
jgi:hypothetical protein